MAFTYPCPDCESEYAFHLDDCSIDGQEMWEIERSYIDILSRLTAREEPWTYNELRDAIDELGEEADEQQDEPMFESIGESEEDKNTMEHPGWTPIHTKCLHYLKQVGRAYEDDDGIVISEPSERQTGVVPKNDPMRTVFEYGPIDGCKDYSVYSIVSWCELIELDWEQTVAFTVYWLRESGRWESEDWGERTPKKLVESKKHIHDKGLGWGEYPEMAKAEMETSSKEPQLDVDSVAAELDRSVLASMSV